MYFYHVFFYSYSAAFKGYLNKNNLIVVIEATFIFINDFFKEGLF